MNPKRYLDVLALTILLGSSGCYSWKQCALDFDGVDDKVTVPAASAQITGGTGISLTCWAYPRNAAPAWPDYDGFAGIRNDTDADFYLLQTSPANMLEARFRNSTGEAFTLEYAGLELNTWQFLALTYDQSDSLLTLYVNGDSVATTMASGSITNSAEDLLVGDLHDGATDYYLDGRMDEVSLWDRVLTAAEIGDIAMNAISGEPVVTPGPSPTTPLLYYKMNDSQENLVVPNGDNTGIADLTSSGSQDIPGTFSGFAMQGAGSNFVWGRPMGQVYSITLCQGEVYDPSGWNLTTPGIYAHGGGSTALGFDSLQTFVFQWWPVPDTTVTLAGATLTAQDSIGPWQWLDCGAGSAVIPGATSQSFTPSENGSYAVEVSPHGCVDTSACHVVLTTGIAARAPGLHARIYPNPTTGRATIEFGHPAQHCAITLSDAQGHELFRREEESTGQMEISLEPYASGIYFLFVQTDEGRGVYRLVKE